MIHVIWFFSCSLISVASLAWLATLETGEGRDEEECPWLRDDEDDDNGYDDYGTGGEDNGGYDNAL